MSKSAPVKNALKYYFANLQSIMKSLELRSLKHQLITLLVIYSIVFQTFFFYVPPVAAQPAGTSGENLKNTPTKSGYFSSFAQSVSDFIRGKDEPTAETNTPEAAVNDMVTAFGPKKFTRTKGAPNNYVETFTLPTECSAGNYKIIIKNGEQNGDYRISSSEIKLNGISLFTESEFNQNVYNLEKSVTAAAENTLEIRLASVPNSYLTIEVRGENCGVVVDTIPPRIIITSPEDNKATTAASINISGTAEDLGTNASGIAGVWVNGTAASYSPTTKIWQLAAVPLSAGANIFTARTVDNGGNEATSQVTVIRDLTNPTVSISTPASGTVTLNSSITISGNASDAGADASGIARVTVNDADAVLDLMTGNWTYENFPLTIGSNTITATVFDRAGNQASSQITVTRVVNQSPQISAGADQTTELPNTALLNGTASDDGYPGGSLSIAWTKIDGAGEVVFSNANNLQTTAAFSAGGNYVLRLSVFDGQYTATDDVAVTVYPENQAPQVYAGDDQTIELPNQAVLSGTATDDGYPAGSSLSVSWSKLSGAGTVTFANPNNSGTNAEFSQPGVYILRLTATDGRLSTTDDIAVTVNPANQAPVVNAGGDRTIELPGAATLSGAATDDGYPVGNSLSYSWSKVSGEGTVAFSNPNDPATTANFSQAGNYVLRLTVSDGALTSSDDVSVTVNPENHAPQVSAGNDQTIALPNAVALSGTAADDGYPAGSSLSVSWTKISGGGTVTFTNAGSPATNASFSQPGVYVLRLTATDGFLSASDDLSVTVLPQNQPPQVFAGNDQTVSLPATGTVSGTTSDDGYPLGGSLTISWSKISGDGTAVFANPNSLSTDVTFSQSGTYVLRLTATDGELTASDDVTVTVNPVNQAPTISAGNDRTIVLPDFLDLNGSAADDGFPPASNLAVSWSKVSGPGEVNFISPNSLTTFAGFSAPGTYTLRLTANDSQLTAFDEVVITVYPRPQCFDGDNFNDNAVDPSRWLVPAPNTQVFERGQRLEIVPFTVPYTVDGSIVYNGYSSAKSCDFTGAIVTVEVAQATPSVYNVETDFRIFGDASVHDNFKNIGFASGGGNLVFFYVLNGVQARRVINFDPVQHRFWRIVHNPLTDRISWETSADNVVWTLQWDAPRPFALDSMKAGLTAGTYLPLANPGMAAFDNFTIRFFDGRNNPSVNQSPTVNAGADQTTSTETGNKMQLFTVNADGTNLTRLTFTSAGEEASQWSPDGTKILFHSDRNGNQEIYVMNADGTNQTRLTYNAAEDVSPYWSPDGTKIYFASARTGNRDLYVMDPDGGNVVQLTSNTDVEYYPRRQPLGPGVNGNKIAFLRIPAGNNNGAEIWIMNADGTGQQKLTNNTVIDDVPVWSPDGARLAFMSARDGNYESYIMNADGTNVQRISNHPAEDWVNDWSPDGKYISYTSNRTGDYEAYSYRVADGVLTRLTYNPAVDYRLYWAPDASKIVFSSDRQGIYLQGSVIDDGLPGGSAMSVSWTKISGPGTVTFGTPNAAGTNARFSQAGTYVLRLTANDGQASAFDEVTVAVAAPPANQAPKVNAGSDAQALTQTPLALTGLVGDDGLPLLSQVSQQWTKISGPGTVTFSAPNSPLTNATFSAAGTYVLRLTASDTQLSAFDEVTVTVAPSNQAPQVFAGVDLTIQLPGAATLNGTATDDGLPAGSAVSVQWSKVSGPGEVLFANPANAATAATFRTAGVYTLRLTASDSLLARSDDVTVTVSSTASGRTTLQFVNADAIDSAGQTYTVKVKLTNWSNNQPISGKPVDFVLNGTPFSAQTDLAGIAEVNLTPAAGTNLVTGMAYFNQDAASYSSLTRIVFPVRDHKVSTVAVFQENFDSEDITGQVLNYNSLRKWSVTRGSIDMFGNALTAGDGVGMVLELDGSSMSAARLETRNALALPAGDYTFYFNMGGNINNASDQMTVSLGSFYNETFVVPGTVSLDTATRAFSLGSPTSAVLKYDHAGGDNHGIFLDQILLVVTNDITPNQPPQVVAGDDIAIQLPATATLNGTATDDGLPNGSALSVNWSKVSGAGDVTFANPNSPATTASFTQAGTYVLRLTASDSQASAFDDMTVVVSPPNQPPAVNAGEDKIVALPSKSFQFIQNNLTQFNQAASAPPVAVDFDGIAAGTDITNTTQNGILFELGNTPSPSAPLVVVKASETFTPTTGFSGVINAATNKLPATSGENVLSPGGTELAPGLNLLKENDDLKITFSEPVAAVGFDVLFQEYDGFSAVGIKIYDPQGTILYQNGNLPVSTGAGGGAPGGKEFFGFVSGRSNIKTIVIDDTDDNNVFPDSNIGFDSFRVQKVLPNTFVTLNGSVTDDGLPAGILTANWTKISGPGTATFIDGALPNARVSFSEAGTYVLRLTGNDSELTASDDVSIVAYNNGQQPANQPPGVNAGADQTVSLPNAAGLFGIVTDDGLPAGSSVAVSWSKVSGAGNVTFSNPNSNATNAAFSAAGTYVLRLTATDLLLTTSDELTITVNSFPTPTPTVTPTVTPTPAATPTPQNQPPQAVAGDDQTTGLNANLIQNGGGEAGLINGELPAWTEVAGTNWMRLEGGQNGVPEPRFGNYVLSPVDSATAEMRQDIDVRGFAQGINNGTQEFILQVSLRSAPETAPDTGRIIVEYRDANLNPIASLDSGDIGSTTAWHLTEDVRVPPAGTGFIRVRLIATRNSGATTDVYFDGASFKAIGNVAAVKLNGAATDDGLPSGNTLQKVWTRESGSGSVSFAAPNTVDSAAVFDTAGAYVLRLSATDGLLSAADEMTVTVNPANQTPQAFAGADQTITLPATVQLNGTASDDGAGTFARWTKVSGPGLVSFSNPKSLTPTVSFSLAGTYALRLMVDDGELETSDDMTITVNPAPANQPPTVDPGTNRTVTLPENSVTLSGTVTDDGLPSGSLSINWTKTSGAGNVTFTDPNSATTTATFNAAGTYILRLTAADGQFTVWREIVVTVYPEGGGGGGGQNQPPTVNAGADQTVTISQTAILEAEISDDGLPAGGSFTANWTKVSGEGTVNFSNPNQTATYATFSQIGTYVVRLTVSDSQASASDDVTVTVVENQPAPTVEILTPDGASINEPTVITGTISEGTWTLDYSLNDSDDPANRSWTTISSGTGATSGNLGSLDTTLLLNGLYDIRLKTIDQFGRLFSDTISVSVERNLKIGHFTVSFEDMSVPVAGIPIQIIRTYDSRDKRKGDFGVGWTLSLKNVRLQKSAVLGLKWYQTRSNTFIPTYCVEATKPHVVTVTMPDGKVEKFEARTERQCQQAGPITETRLIFTPQAGTRGTLSVVGDNTVFVAGSIPGPADLIAYDGTGIFDRATFKYTAKDGTEFIVNQSGGLQSVKDTNGNSLTISANGITHSSGKSVTFTRDPQGRITAITDPNGKSNVYTYDADGDLISYKDREENTTSFTYEPTIAHHLKSIVDPLNRTPIRNDYDASGRLLKHIDSNGNEIIYTHNLAESVEIVTDRLGNPTTFEYDAHGNVLKKRDALGHETVFSYDANDNVLTETNALGKTTTYTYDAQDNRTSVTDALGNKTEFTYNTKGQPLTVKDARSNVTTNTYDTAGNLLTTKDALGNVTTNIYSIQTGQLSLTKDALNNVTTFEYFGSYLTKQTDAQGNETTFSYDANGNRKTQTVKRTNAAGQLETITRTAEYDDLNRLVKSIQPDGSFTRTEYNELGQQKATIDQGGNRTEFTYDDQGRLIKTMYADGKFEESTYDEEGRRLTSKDRSGKVTSYQYDALGRLKKNTYADGTFTTTVYDAAGQVLNSTDARNNVTTYTYDDAGRRLTVKNALNQITSFAYDPNGNQLTMTDALNHTATNVYDVLNRRTKTIFADNSFTETTFDELGRRTAEKDQAGKTTQFVYDALGRLSKVKDALFQETRYEYNELGQQVKQIDALNRETKYEYDRIGRRTKRILPLGQTETYSYDTDGNLRSKTDFNGKTTTFAYDEMRRLLSKTPDASLNQPAVSFTYNVLGQRASMTDASGSTVYAYDNRNRLQSKQTPFGALSYTYNDAGNIETLRSSNVNGVSVDYDYDELNRLASLKDNRLTGNQTSTYTYDAVGNLQSYAYPNQVTTSYTYNNLNRLATMTVSNQQGGLASYTYTLGAAGNRTQVVEGSGRRVNYVYDDLYRLTQETIANSSNNGQIGYQYDAVGNRLQRTSNVIQVADQSSTFDANDRLNPDTYDANGNTKISNGKTYNYDFENKLTSTSNGITIVYDGDGNRVSKTVGGVTTNYLVDTNNLTGYTQVVEEIVGGQVTKQYTYGHDLISQRKASGVSFYNYDGHGSARGLSNASGNITDTYSYDAFGTLIERTGTTDNNYLYAGEQFDADLGFYYNRARYLNVETGRFVSMDSHEGSLTEPLALHKYIYANNNSPNQIDPNGLSSIAEEAIVTDFIGIGSTYSYAPLATVSEAALAEFAASTAITATATAGTATTISAGSAVSSVLAFLGSAAFGLAVSSLSSDHKNEEENEIFYRVMSDREYYGLRPNGGITVTGTENFVTQSPEYVIQLALRHPNDYQKLVVYVMEPGTRDALVSQGAKNNSAANIDPTLTGLPHISTFPKRYPNIVNISGELGSITYGLRQGTVHLFNSRIKGFVGVQL
jgi:RHS repeat-associated protein